MLLWVLSVDPPPLCFGVTILQMGQGFVPETHSIVSVQEWQYRSGSRDREGEVAVWCLGCDSHVSPLLSAV